MSARPVDTIDFEIVDRSVNGASAMTLAVEKAKEARQKDWQRLYKREVRKREKEKRMQMMQQDYLFRHSDTERYGMGPCGEFRIPPIMFGSSGGSSSTSAATAPIPYSPNKGRLFTQGRQTGKRITDVDTPMKEEPTQPSVYVTPQMDPSSVAAAHLQALIESENKRRQKVDEAQLEWDKRCLAAWEHEMDRRKQWDISHQLQQAERSRKVEAEERRRKEFNCYIQHRIDIEDVRLTTVPPDHPPSRTEEHSSKSESSNLKK